MRVEDEPFLVRVLADTRREELDLLPWGETEKDAFIRSQHAAQHSHYTASWPEASLHVVLVDDEPAGRIYVQRDAEAIHLLEISLLREHRDRGVGTSLLQSLLAEADLRGVKVTAHVERGSRALGLYERLGFRPVAERGLHLLIERPPGSSGDA